MIGVAPATDAALNYNAWWIIGLVLVVGIAVAVHNHWLHKKLHRKLDQSDGV